MSNKQNERGRVAQGDDAGGDLGGYDRRGGKSTGGIVCVYRPSIESIDRSENM